MEAIHFPADGLRRDTTARLAYRRSKGSCLYADARPPLTNSHSKPELWTRFGHLGYAAQVGRAIGVIAEIRKLAILCLRSSRARNFSPCDTPRRKAASVAHGAQIGLSPFGGNSHGGQIRPLSTCSIASDHSGAALMYPVARALSRKRLMGDFKSKEWGHMGAYGGRNLSEIGKAPS